MLPGVFRGDFSRVCERTAFTLILPHYTYLNQGAFYLLEDVIHKENGDALVFVSCPG